MTGGLGVGGRTDARTRQRPHCVYKHYDKDDVLLYVGCCLDPTGRTYQHVGTTTWARYAVRSEGRWYPDFEAGRAAETEAIRTEQPIFNVHGYPLDHRPNDGERRATRDRYMLEHAGPPP